MSTQKSKEYWIPCPSKEEVAEWKRNRAALPRNTTGPGSSSQNPVYLDGPGTGPDDPICIASSPREASPASTVLSELSDIPDETYAEINAELAPYCTGKTFFVCFKVPDDERTMTDKEEGTQYHTGTQGISFCNGCPKSGASHKNETLNVLMCTECDHYKLFCLPHVEQHSASEQPHKLVNLNPTNTTASKPGASSLKQYQKQRLEIRSENWSDGVCIGTIGKVVKPEAGSLHYDKLDDMKKEKRWCTECFRSPDMRQRSNLFTAEFSVFDGWYPARRCYTCEYRLCSHHSKLYEDKCFLSSVKPELREHQFVKNVVPSEVLD